MVFLTILLDLILIINALISVIKTSLEIKAIIIEKENSTCNRPKRR